MQCFSIFCHLSISKKSSYGRLVGHKCINHAHKNGGLTNHTSQFYGWWPVHPGHTYIKHWPLSDSNCLVVVIYAAQVCSVKYFLHYLICPIFFELEFVYNETVGDFDFPQHKSWTRVGPTCHAIALPKSPPQIPTLANLKTCRLSHFCMKSKASPVYQWYCEDTLNMSDNMTKPTKWLCAQRRVRSAWASESSLSAWRKLGSLATHTVHSQDSDQTGLIWVFAGHTVTLLALSCRGSYQFLQNTAKIMVLDSLAGNIVK